MLISNEEREESAKDLEEPIRMKGEWITRNVLEEGGEEKEKGSHQIQLLIIQRRSKNVEQKASQNGQQARKEGSTTFRISNECSQFLLG